MTLRLRACNDKNEPCPYFSYPSCQLSQFGSSRRSAADIESGCGEHPAVVAEREELIGAARERGRHGSVTFQIDCASCGGLIETQDPDAHCCRGCREAICQSCVDVFDHVGNGLHAKGNPRDAVMEMRAEIASSRTAAKMAQGTEIPDGLASGAGGDSDTPPVHFGQWQTGAPPHPGYYLADGIGPPWEDGPTRCRFDSKGRWTGGDLDMQTVTHWMPLPAPPRPTGGQR